MEVRFEVRSRGRHRVIVEAEIEAGDAPALERCLEAVTRSATSYANLGSERWAQPVARRPTTPAPEAEG